MDNLKELHYILKNSRPTVVLGSGITLENIEEIKNEFKSYDNFDIHVGTAVRHGKVEEDVDVELVKKFIDLAK